MRHRRKNIKFSRPRAQREALMRSLLRTLIIYESIRTTESKAKSLRPHIDKLIEWGKDNTLHTRRLAYRILNDHRLVKKLFKDIAPRFMNTNGGYTRIIDVGRRKGDGAKVSIIEFTKIEKKLKSKKSKGKKDKVVSTQVEKKEEPSLEKEIRPQKKFFQGLKNIFKKGKGSL